MFENVVETMDEGEVVLIPISTIKVKLGKVDEQARDQGRWIAFACDYAVNIWHHGDARENTAG